MTDENTIKITIRLNINFASALAVGIISGIGFHPIDRALYLRMVDDVKGSIFDAKYWSFPMAGLRNTIYQRILSNGVYFALQGELNSRLALLTKKGIITDDRLPKVAIGLAAGTATGFFSNANYAIKFYTFSHETTGKPLENAIKMWRDGGYRPFVKGICPGVARDALFGVSYEGLRLLLKTHLSPKESNEMKNTVFYLYYFLAAFVATAISSPFNYARNMQFHTLPKNKQPKTFDILHKLWVDSSVGNPLFRLRFLNQRLMLGVGTIRAATGMATGQILFDKIPSYLRHITKERKCLTPG